MEEKKRFFSGNGKKKFSVIAIIGMVIGGLALAVLFAFLLREDGEVTAVQIKRKKTAIPMKILILIKKQVTRSKVHGSIRHLYYIM